MLTNDKTSSNSRNLLLSTLFPTIRFIAIRHHTFCMVLMWRHCGNLGSNFWN